MKTAKEIKPFLAKKYYKNRCYVCHKKFGKYFAFHHLWYEIKDARYSMFKSNTNKYHIELAKYIKLNPKRFILLCRGHHHLVEWGASVKDKAKWKRFCKARAMTKT
jgi:hypothetical protein